MIRLFRVSIPISVLGLLTSESTLVFGCYLLAWYWQVGGVGAYSDLNLDYGSARVAALVITFVFGAYLADLYAEIKVRSHVVLVSRVMSILGAAVLCEALIGYVNTDWAVPSPVVITGSLVTLIVLSAWRILYSAAVMNMVGSHRILFAGCSPLALHIASHLGNRPELGVNVIGCVANQPTDGVKWLGSLEEISSVVRRVKPDTVVVAIGADREALPMDELLDVRFAGIPIEEATVLYEETFGRVCIEEIEPYQLILSTQLGPRRWTVRLQMIYSMAIAFFATIIAAPVVAVAALLIKATSPGPAFYRQTRVGSNGRTFRLYKLRSMYQNAEVGTGAVWATHNDSRVTPFGRLLRKSRIDELPQLLNVLKGEMSIVGPRPERPEFTRELSETIPYYRQRHCVRPGITGWAQINYRYGETVQDTKVKLEFDLYYIKNLSPSLDAYIMFQTLKTMLLSRGAQ